MNGPLDTFLYLTHIVLPPQIILFPIRLFTLSMIITVAATGILVQALFNTHVTIAVVIVAGTTLIMCVARC